MESIKTAYTRCRNVLARISEYGSTIIYCVSSPGALTSTFSFHLLETDAPGCIYRLCVVGLLAKVGCPPGGPYAFRDPAFPRATQRQSLTCTGSRGGLEMMLTQPRTYTSPLFRFYQRSVGSCRSRPNRLGMGGPRFLSHQNCQ